MCQVTPFTLPCCQRIYVLIEKLPSCPADWPKSKCPRELCIQIINPDTGHVPQRPSGTCWRCKAAAEGKTDDERDSMRPGIDSAKIVVGLEELEGPGGRKRVKMDGKCWFCGAARGCQLCGSQKSEAGPAGMPTQKPGEGRAGRPRKKARIEENANSQAPSYLEPAPFFEELSQLTFYKASHDTIGASRFPRTSNSMLCPPMFHHEALSYQSNLPDSTIGNRQLGQSVMGMGNAAYWENPGGFQANRPAVVGGSEGAQHFDLPPTRTVHPPQAGVGADLSSASHDHVSSDFNTASQPAPSKAL
jgi:hypothetical protein